MRLKRLIKPPAQPVVLDLSGAECGRFLESVRAGFGKRGEWSKREKVSKKVKSGEGAGAKK